MNRYLKSSVVLFSARRNEAPVERLTGEIAALRAR
jgi:hypothetical protein